VLDGERAVRGMRRFTLLRRIGGGVRHWGGMRWYRSGEEEVPGGYWVGVGRGGYEGAAKGGEVDEWGVVGANVRV
jgi:hypothetical protein